MCHGDVMIFAAWVSVCLSMGAGVPGAPFEHGATSTTPVTTIRADLRLRTGGSIGGAVLDATEHGLVVLSDRTPHVFSWAELEPESAYETKGALVALSRGGDERVTAEDYLQLGRFAHRHGLADRAHHCFERAVRLDAAIRSRVRSTVAAWDRDADGVAPWNLSAAAPEAEDEPSAARSAPSHTPAATIAVVPLAQRRAEVRKAYQTFGAKVREVMGEDVVLIETKHFLIWTDWPDKPVGRSDRERLGPWCDAMYAALCGQFGLDVDTDVFLAKCPIYCWRSKPRFQRFARYFDGYAGTDAVGYTRTIAENGHVHVVLVRQGSAPADLDRFACTLVHEGTHAFLHRLHSSALIPHWINEGYAELIAERVLGDRCPAGENAALLAKQIERYDWPLGGLLAQTAPIEVHQYPIAHSVVAYLEGRDPNAFAGFIRSLKDGLSIASALSKHFDLSSVHALERAWRASISGDGPS